MTAPRAIVLALLAVAACGGAASEVDDGSLIVTSAAFVEGGALPAELACLRDGGTGASPPIAWTGAPAGTRSIALSMIHYPLGTTPGVDTPSHYWLLWNLDATITALPAGNPDGLGVEGSAKDGVTTGYTPPCSPSGAGLHTYTLQVHALSAPPSALGTTDSVAVGYAAFVAGIEPLLLASGALSFTN